MIRTNHSTERALRISSDSPTVSVLVLVGLTAAFETVDVMIKMIVYFSIFMHYKP